MRVLRDHEGVAIRLTDERLIHILERPEMRPFGHEIEQALATPLRVIESLSDPSARLYYRHYDVTPVGAKFLCVVVRFSEADSFVLTAYLTSRVKRGVLLWPRRK